MQKLLVVSCFLFIGSGTYAQPQPPADPALFNQHKAEILADLDIKIKSATEAKNCVNQANDPGTLRSCMDKMQDSMSQLRDGRRDRRMQHMERRLEMMRQQQNPPPPKQK